MGTRITKLFNTVSGTDANAPLVSGVAVTGTNTYYSEVWTGMDQSGYGLQLEWTGTPTGTFTLWMSDKGTPDLTTDNDWVQDTSWSPTNPAGAAGKARDDVSMAFSRRKRLKYVNASGTGTIFGYVTTAAE